eukprot:7174591-Prymnesium_polylepis.1
MGMPPPICAAGPVSDSRHPPRPEGADRMPGAQSTRRPSQPHEGPAQPQPLRNAFARTRTVGTMPDGSRRTPLLRSSPSVARAQLSHKLAAVRRAAPKAWRRRRGLPEHLPPRCTAQPRAGRSSFASEANALPGTRGMAGACASLPDLALRRGRNCRFDALVLVRRVHGLSQALHEHPVCLVLPGEATIALLTAVPTLEICNGRAICGGRVVRRVAPRDLVAAGRRCFGLDVAAALRHSLGLCELL